MVKSEGEGLGIAIYNLVRAHRHAKKKEYCIRTFCFQIYLKYECEGLRIAIYNLVRYTHTHTQKGVLYQNAFAFKDT
jgi:hypothetical protein